MKRYKLLKELPTFHTGDEFILANDGCLYLARTIELPWETKLMAYHRKTLKKFPDILNDWFEKIEEPKEHWCITMYGGITRIKDNEEPIDDLIEIDNYFSSKEDAYDAWEKLKAWKRLKDKGFRFNRWTIPEEPKTPHIKLVIGAEMDVPDSPYDLDLLFGGEE